MDAMVQIASLRDLPKDTPTEAAVGGMQLVVLRHDGAVRVFEGRCPHRGLALAEGRVENGSLVCAGHGWRFDCATGRATNRSGVRLHQFEAVIDGDAVLVDRNQLLQWQRRTGEAAEASAQSARAAPRRLADLPGPRGLPLVGNLFQLDARRMHQTLEQWHETYGSAYTCRIGTKRFLVTSRPSIIREVLRNRPQSARRLDTIEPVFREMGVDGVFSAEGEAWRRQRRFVMQGLDTRHLRQFLPTLVKVTQRLKERWAEWADSQRLVDVQKDLMCYTVDVTTNLSFGYDMNTLQKGADVLQEHLERALRMAQRRLFAPVPYWRYVKLPSDRALDAALNEIDEIVNSFIDMARDRLARRPELVEHPTNFLEALLAAQQDDAAPLRDEEIAANVLTLLVAGEDTTANTMAWMMHYMMEHPDVQQRMRAEADAVLGAERMPLTLEAANRLLFIDATAHETLRLKAVTPLFYVTMNETMIVDDLELPRGTSVIFLLRAGGLREEDFSEAHRFHPERWLGSGARSGVSHRPTYIPFGDGPRLCPGRSLALLEIKMVMSMLCRNFELVAPEGGAAVGERLRFTMMPENLFGTFRARRED